MRRGAVGREGVPGSGEVTTDTYTTTGQLASVTTGSASTPLSTISYCHDPTGNQTAVVYGNGNTPGTPTPCETSAPWVVSSSSYPTAASYQTTYSYDSASELVSTTAPATAAAPSGATTSETYDPSGNTLTRTDPNGVTATWTYTPLNQPSAVTYSGGSAHSVSYGYDAESHKMSMSDATGSSSYVYDPFGELISATNGASQAVGYGYNADGIATSVTYPLPASATWATSHTVSYTVDNADLLLSATDFNGNQISISNTADGQPQSATLGSTGDTITTTYDNTDTPSSIKLENSTTTLQSFTYSDSPDGTILSETDTPTSPQSPATYTYDTEGRATSMTLGTGPALNYTFDASSNLTTLPNGADATSGYDKAGELTSSTLSGTTTTSYTYNADGERLTAKQGTTTIASGTWNGTGQLTAYSDASGSMSAATYDGTGLRASATTSSGAQQFIWNADSSIQQLLMDSSSAYIYCGSSLAEQVNLAAGTVTYLVTDSLGSVRGTVDSTGTLTGTTSYDAWGNPLTPGGLTNSTPFGYVGGYTDRTGLIYLINRYYEPQTGQFLSLDPLVRQTVEPYGYASEDPIINTDPDGQSFQDWAAWNGYSAGKGWIPTGLLHVYLNGSDMVINYFKAQFITIRKLHHASIRVYVTWDAHGRPCGFWYTRRCYPLGEMGFWTGLNEGGVMRPYVRVRVGLTEPL